MTSPITWPRRFERYTDEFLHQHPSYAVLSESPLRVLVPTRRGPEDDAVAIAELQARIAAASRTCETLVDRHEDLMDAAHTAHQRWVVRQTTVAHHPAWQLAHVALQVAAPLLPKAPLPRSLRRAPSWALLAAHIGTAYAAAQSAKGLTRASLRLASLQDSLETLGQELSQLRTAVRRDISMNVRTPARLDDDPKFRDRLLGCLQIQQQVLAAMADTKASLPTRRARLAAALPSVIYEARLHELLTAQTLSGADTASTPVSTCAPESPVQSIHDLDGAPAPAPRPLSPPHTQP